jgi:hypothetical protein
MFRDKANPMRRNRAVTLIEAVLYISIALALIVGGLVFYQQASTAAKTNTMVRQLSALIAEARAVMVGHPPDEALFNITSFLISAGAVPPDMVTSPTSLSNPFGGTTEVQASSGLGVRHLIIRLSNVPQGVCARLLTATSGSAWFRGSGGSGGTTLVSSGYIAGGAADESVGARERGTLLHNSYIMNPTQAGWMCKYGTLYYQNQNVEPDVAPFSGTVAVGMRFLLDT